MTSEKQIKIMGIMVTRSEAMVADGFRAETNTIYQLRVCWPYGHDNPYSRDKAQVESRKVPAKNTLFG